MLTDIIEAQNGRTIIFGDFNGRVVKRTNEITKAIGPHGENHKNNHGDKLINTFLYGKQFDYH